MVVEKDEEELVLFAEASEEVSPSEELRLVRSERALPRCNGAPLLAAKPLVYLRAVICCGWFRFCGVVLWWWWW